MVRAIPAQDLSCDPARRPCRRCSHDRPYLAFRARQAMSTVSGASSCSSRTYSKELACTWACFIEQRAPHLIHSLAGASKRILNLLSRSSACTPVSTSLNKIGTQTRNRRGLDNADVIGVVVDGYRVVLRIVLLNGCIKTHIASLREARCMWRDH